MQVESESDEEPVATNEPAIKPQPQEATPRPGSQTPVKGAQTPASRASRPPSRATSPAAVSHGGHSIVAKRATSPKAASSRPTLPGGTIRGTSPLANGGSRAVSPNGSRATSPVADGRAVSPSGQIKPNNKRKAVDEAGSPGGMSAGGDPGTPGGGAQPKPKKRKSMAPAGELTDQSVIEWLQSKTNASTRECIAHFQPYLADDAVLKKKFTSLIKKIVNMKGGVMTLKKEYRRDGGISTINGGPTAIADMAE